WLKQYEQSHFSLPSWPSLHNAIKWQTPRCLQSDGESQKWPVDDDSLSAIVERFIDDKLTTYEQQRDFPAIKGTSGLSPYLALGIISVKQLLVNVQQRHPDILQSAKSNLFSWVNELIWREFYRHLIVAYPRLCKHANFNAKYDAVKWR
ncbi:deoxyribodipyrimidine photo-lyase, partial [Pseudoalteromonas rubra]